MRTTVSLDDDVLAGVEEVRRLDGSGLSEALNKLLRLALARKPPRSEYKHRSHELGLRLNVDNVAEVLEILEED